MNQGQIAMTRAGPGHTERICGLLARVFPNNCKADPAILRWQYWNAPFGDTVCCIQTAGTEVVGHVARVFVPMVVEGRRTRGGITVDAATDPRFRNLGLYGALRSFSNVEASREGMEVCIDFRSFRTKLPTGAAPQADRLKRFAIPLDARWLSERFRIPRTVAKGLVHSARSKRSGGGLSNEFPDGIQALWTDIAPKISFGVEKNEAWWRWRYEEHPHRPYRYYSIRSGETLLAAAATRPRPGQDVLAVLDLVARSSDAGARLVGAIARSCDEGALAFIASRGSPWADIARAGGFRAVPFDRERQSLFVRDLTERRPNLSRQPWAVTWGDMDHL